MHGVWFAPERDRALLLLQTRAAGMDIGAQDGAEAAIQAAFAAAGPGAARLLAAGPAVFARAAAAGIRSDVRLCSIASGLLVTGLLLWRFRSLAVLAAVAVPLLLSVAAAALATQAVFGCVHGIALGFGMTMLGVTVDYPVLFIGHRKLGEPAAGTLARIGRAFALAVVCAALGLSGMVVAGFPGIAQLGLFAASGVVAAALATWLILPPLIVAADLAPVWAGDPGQLLRIEGWRRFRLWGLLPVALAAGGLLLAGGPRWEADVANLSPVPRATLALDAELRREIGAPDLGAVLAVHAASADAVLARQEALAPRSSPWSPAPGSGYEAAARLLPSRATQAARQAALPDAACCTTALPPPPPACRSGPTRSRRSSGGGRRARRRAGCTLGSAWPPALAARLRPLLFERDGHGGGRSRSTARPARPARGAGRAGRAVRGHARARPTRWCTAARPGPGGGWRAAAWRRCWRCWPGCGNPAWWPASRSPSGRRRC